RSRSSIRFASFAAIASSSLELQQPSRIAFVDCVPLRRRDIEPVNDLDGGAGVHRAALRIERRIRSEEHPFGPEELESAPGCLHGAKERRVGIEEMKVVDRPALELAQQRAVIDVRGARAKL